MIKPEDVEFHRSASTDWAWCETNFFPFTIPEKGISGGVYLVTRPNLGVCMSDITIQDRIALGWEQQLYVDNQQHMPCPRSLLEFSLPNGLSLRAVDPLKHYEIRYEGVDDTLIEFSFRSLMHPHDINDPKEDPLASGRIGGGWDNAFAGHFEMTGRIEGKARIRGVDYRLDSVDTADRSWGVRKERNLSNAAWMHGSFGEELTIHLLTNVDPVSSNEYGKPITGYVLEKGKVYGLTDISGRFSNIGLLTVGNTVDVTDSRGKRFRMVGTAVNAAPWAPYPSAVYSQSYMRWDCEGRTGYGVLQHGMSRAYLTRHRDRLGAA